mgnify:CR=1 FL=1
MDSISLTVNSTDKTFQLDLYFKPVSMLTSACFQREIKGYKVCLMKHINPYPQSNHTPFTCLCLLLVTLFHYSAACCCIQNPSLFCNKANRREHNLTFCWKHWVNTTRFKVISVFAICIFIEYLKRGQIFIPWFKNKQITKTKMQSQPSQNKSQHTWRKKGKTNQSQIFMWELFLVYN